MMDDRAVTQTLGFALTFAVIITSVTIVAAVGTDQLETFRDSQELQNAERSMILVKSNVDEIQDGRAIARSGELDLDRGELDLLPASESRLRIRIENTTGPPVDYEETLVTSGLRYQLEDTTIGYENGAVFRAGQTGAAVMQRSPKFACTDDRALLSVVTIDGERDRQLGGGTVEVRVEHNTSSIRFPVNRDGANSTEGRANVTVDVVESPFASGWDQYFDGEDGWTRDSDQFVCAGDSGNGVSSYQVVQTRVTVTFTR